MGLWDSISSIFDSGSSTPSSGGGWSSDLVSGLISAGSGLANTYFSQKQNQQIANQQIQQRQAEMAQEERLLQLKLAAQGGGGGGGGSGSAEKIARMNNLAQLYANYAQLTQKGGESEASTAIQTGKLMQDPIVARLGALR
jgi:hypothetical protein